VPLRCCWSAGGRSLPGSSQALSNAAASSVSALAAQGAAGRWVMTLAFLIAGACEVATAWR
jgi:hypothetical protein